MYSTRWISFIASVCSLFCLCCSSPCQVKNHVTVRDIRRSVFYSPGPADSLLCDWYDMRPSIPGRVPWYRFISGEMDAQIPEVCVQRNRCGTQVPIWMNGFHPKAYNQVTTHRVCAQFDQSSCCSWNSTIEVMRCNRIAAGMVSSGGGPEEDSFYVYHLPQPIGCPMAYCMLSERPCSIGRVYNNKTNSCDERHPAFSNVTLHGPTVVNNHIEFSCSFRPARDLHFDDGSRYEVNFYFDNQMVSAPDATIMLNSQTNRAVLHERYLRLNMGKQLSCSVSSKWEGYDEYRSEPKHSNNTYYVGIKLKPNEITLSEQDQTPVSLEIISTLPVLCKRSQMIGRCELTVRVMTPERLVANMQSSPTMQPCTYRIGQDTSPNDGGVREIDLTDPNAPLPGHGDESSQGEVIKEKGDSVELFVRRGATVNGPSSTEITFERFPFSVVDVVEHPDGTQEMTQSIWDDYLIPPVPVTLQADTRMATCQSTSDPRMITWDGLSYTILSRVGEFYLWLSGAPRSFEVHVRHWLCQPDWITSCVCGIAAREADTVLIVDLCGSRQKDVPRVKVTRLSRNGGEPNPAATVTRDGAGNTFSINMPSGARILIDAHTWGMNVHSMAPAEDYQQVQGLCGTFDNNTRNDFTVRDSWRQGTREEFVDSWRIPVGQSLFDTPPPDFANFVDNNDKDDDDVVQFCGCKSGLEPVVSCGRNDRIETDLEVGQPSIEFDEMISHHVLDQMFHFQAGSRRRRRSLVEDVDIRDITYSDMIDDEPDYPFDYSEEPLVTLSQQWPSLTGITQQQATDACLDALRMSSIFEVCSLVDGVEVLDPMERCIDDIRLMSDLSWAENAVRESEYKCLTTAMQSTNTSGVNSQDVAKHLCPNHCNRNGSCVDGKCVCNEGLVGADCSLTEGVIPNIRYLTNNGLCDITRRPCRLARLVVTEVIDSPSLKCKIQQVEIIGGRHQPVNESETTYSNATMNTNAEVTCPVPPTTVRLGTPTTHPSGITQHGMKISLSNDGEEYSDPAMMLIHDATCLQCSGENEECWPRGDSCEVSGHCFEAGEADPDDWCMMCDPERNMFEFSDRIVNEPPTFVTDSKITRLADEELIMQIVVNDPEDRPVVFSLEFSTSLDVTLQPDGTLVWGPDAPNDVEVPLNERPVIMLETKVTDECGAEAVAVFELSVTACNCNHHGTCIPMEGSSRGEGLYQCLCDPFYTGQGCEVVVDPCEDMDCIYGNCTSSDESPNHYYCDCLEGYVGPLCDEQATYPVGDVQGMWSDWGEYTTCSMPCDHGVMIRQRTCHVLPCSGQPSETRLCNTHQCPENVEEKELGVLLSITDFTVHEMREREITFLDSVASAMNLHCRLNVEDCCGMTSSITSNIPQEFVTWSNFRLATGYPRIINSEEHIWKVIGRISSSHLQRICTSEVSGHAEALVTDEEDLYIDSDLLMGAINRQASLFNEIFSFTMEVLPPDTPLYRTTRAPYVPTTEGTPKEKADIGFLLYIFVGVAAVAVIIIVTIIVVVYCRKRL